MKVWYIALVYLTMTPNSLILFVWLITLIQNAFIIND